MARVFPIRERKVDRDSVYHNLQSEGKKTIRVIRMLDRIYSFE